MTRHIVAATSLVLLVLAGGHAALGLGEATPRNHADFCRPDLPCWPTPSDWQQLAAALVGKLEAPQSPLLPCRTDATGDACLSALKSARNPFYLADQPGGTQSTGWLGAWTAATSAYSVAAETPRDIVAAVNFARTHKIRLAIKSTGHDYLGRSNAPDGLLVWTHKMREIKMHDAFVGRGCPAKNTGVPAVTMGAGTMWLEAYQEVAVKHGRYVQGGGCTSVGAAGGFTQGGGFGSWSKKWGTSAAGMLEAEVVTADGKLLVANACQNQDLFWALRGGGGGTFGVVTNVTLLTHPLPSFFGLALGSITARTDGEFKELLEHFIGFYRQNLQNERWGEQVKIRGKNSLQLMLAFQGITAKEAEHVLLPLRSWIERRPEAFTIATKYVEIPGNKMWDFAYAKQQFGDFVEADKRSDHPDGWYWWAGNQEEVLTYWYAYQSRWLPAELFEEGKAKALATALFDASRHWSLELHFNKGLAGASDDAVRRGHETSTNPKVYNAAALVIASAHGPGIPNVLGHEPDLVEGDSQKSRVSAAMKIMRDATPGAGTYLNEADYFEANWQQEFWGENYAKLLDIKRKYDPEGMFVCHHCVGSEE